MSNIAGVALFTASLFLLVVAVMLNSPALFYMSTAMVATIVAARIQAFSAVRNLAFERRVSPSVRVGEWAEVQLVIQSPRRTRRPLIRVLDHLPPRLVTNWISPSTPVAPAYGEPVVSKYRFKPLRRGVYRWSKLTVVGHDALGIVTISKEYPANAVELIVLPNPIPVGVDIVSAMGYGTTESEHGLSRGTGIEPRGIREYVHGDSMRYIHWRSSAKKGSLVVKEFETGSNASAAFFVQCSEGSERGKGAQTTLELQCGHLAYITARGIRQGVNVQFPALEPPSKTVSPSDREIEISRLLARIEADSPTSLGEDILRVRRELEPGCSVFLAISVVDPTLPGAVDALRKGGHAVEILAYDATYFEPKFPLEHSATHSPYLDELRAAGARVKTMPMEGLSEA